MCFRKFSMQISAAITEKYISIYGLVNIADHATKTVYTPMFSGSMKTIKLCSEWYDVLQ